MRIVEHVITYTESSNPLFRWFQSVREAMDEPERVEVSVDGPEIRFQPVEGGDDGLNVTPSTGDVSAAGVVSEHHLSINERRYEAVSLEDSTWVINVSVGSPNPVGGQHPFVETLREGLTKDEIEQTVTVDEIRENR